MAINKSKTKLLFNPYGDNNINENKGLVSDKYGFVPKSIWDVKKSKKLTDYVNDVIGNKSFKDKGKGGKKGETKLSLFNPDVVMRIIKYYTLQGDIVVAPYGSRGVIGIVSYLCGRHSYSCDVVPKYMNEIKNTQKIVKDSIGDNDTILESFLCDAVTSKLIGTKTVTELGYNAIDIKTKKFKSDFADLILFNPPYWNVEKYESTDYQMSDINTYDDFLVQYKKAIEQHYRILKPNGFAIAVVNDFRREDTFYNFHGDTISLCKEVGFIQHDIIINSLNGQAMQAVGSFEKLGLKIMPKCHEYVLVFRKPSADGDNKSYRNKWS